MLWSGVHWKAFANGAFILIINLGVIMHFHIFHLQTEMEYGISIWLNDFILGSERLPYEQSPWFKRQKKVKSSRKKKLTYLLMSSVVPAPQKLLLWRCSASPPPQSLPLPSSPASAWTGDISDYIIILNDHCDGHGDS